MVFEHSWWRQCLSHVGGRENLASPKLHTDTQGLHGLPTSPIEAGVVRISLMGQHLYWERWQMFLLVRKWLEGTRKGVGLVWGWEKMNGQMGNQSFKHGIICSYLANKNWLKNAQLTNWFDWRTVIIPCRSKTLPWPPLSWLFSLHVWYGSMDKLAAAAAAAWVAAWEEFIRDNAERPEALLYHSSSNALS